jgi:hypothetical protein
LAIGCSTNQSLGYSNGCCNGFNIH